jgi:hypothetical protein
VVRMFANRWSRLQQACRPRRICSPNGSSTKPRQYVFFPHSPRKPMKIPYWPQQKLPIQPNNQGSSTNEECVALDDHVLALLFAGRGRRAGILLSE